MEKYVKTREKKSKLEVKTQKVSTHIRMLGCQKESEGPCELWTKFLETAFWAHRNAINGHFPEQAYVR